MKHSIIIPQRGLQRELTEPLVAQLQEWEPEAEILVVDDGKGQAASRQDISGARMIFHRGLERGLTLSWNLGIKRASGERLCLLNNDVVCTGPFLKALSQAGGITGAKMRHDKDSKGPVLEGWCLCFSRDVMRAMVSFDESMTTYFSDTDFQLRAQLKGYALTAFKVPLAHKGHKTTHNAHAFPDRKKIWKRDQAAFKAKWEGKL